MPTTITDGTVTVTPRLVEGYESARASKNLFHPVIGRNSPDVTLRPADLRTGSLTFLFTVEADAIACETMHQSGVFTLTDTDVPSVDMTYVLDGSVTRTLDPDVAHIWHVTVDFQEVAP